MTIPLPMLIQLGTALLQAFLKVADHIDKTGKLPEHVDLDAYAMKPALEILEEEQKKRKGGDQSA